MGLPIKIRGVRYYRVSGAYIFAGDLYIARGTIYFFPMVDLEEQRTKSSKHLPHQIGFIVYLITYLLQVIGTSYASEDNFWEEGISDEQFRRKADAYIEVLKVERKKIVIHGQLPLPTRVTTNEISDMKLNRTGRLSFLSQSDNHDFDVGLRNRNRLRNAIWEGGLGKV